MSDGLLETKRRLPLALGHVSWAGRDGRLVLAPPLVYGGEMGDHMIFRWKAAGVDRAISLHAWAPRQEAVATLRAMVVAMD